MLANLSKNLSLANAMISDLAVDLEGHGGMWRWGFSRWLNW
ncbi:hypothetical protein ACLEJQ_01355 [Pseudomonas sp. SMV71]